MIKEGLRESVGFEVLVYQQGFLVQRTIFPPQPVLAFRER
jgi:hypothetical protein